MSPDPPAWPCAVPEATISAAAAMRHHREFLIAVYGPGVAEAVLASDEQEE